MKWEYLISKSFPAELNQVGYLDHLGSRGWELIISLNGTLIFKRPLQSANAGKPQPVENAEKRTKP